MKRYTLIERESCESRYIRARNAKHAVQKAIKWVHATANDELEKTDFVGVGIYAGGPRNTPNFELVDEITVTVHPQQPRCIDGKREHAWKEAGGPWSSGGGVRFKHRCTACGSVQHTDTWATNPNNGTQGHESIYYTKEEA